MTGPCDGDVMAERLAEAEKRAGVLRVVAESTIEYGARMERERDAACAARDAALDRCVREDAARRIAEETSDWLREVADTLRAEGDEARAEVERLRAALADVRRYLREVAPLLGEGGAEAQAALDAAGVDRD